MPLIPPRRGPHAAILPSGESQSCKHILGVQQGTAEILEGEPYSAKAKAKKRVWLVQGSGTNKYTVTHEPEEAEEEEPPRAKAQKTEPEVKCEDRRRR